MYKTYVYTNKNFNFDGEVAESRNQAKNNTSISVLFLHIQELSSL
mgnify:CR=1 FL=1